MPANKTIILQHQEIVQKITRMAWQILENNHDAGHLVIVGVEKKGTIVSKMLFAKLQEICDLQISHGSLFVDKNKPSLETIKLKCAVSLHDANVILVDDVLNSGKTLMYATLPILAQSPRQLHTAILANRDHTRFPIKADFVGISLATTLQEHIQFVQAENKEMTVYLT